MDCLSCPLPSVGWSCQGCCWGCCFSFQRRAQAQEACSLLRPLHVSVTAKPELTPVAFSSVLCLLGSAPSAPATLTYSVQLQW